MCHILLSELKKEIKNIHFHSAQDAPPWQLSLYSNSIRGNGINHPDTRSEARLNKIQNFNHTLTMWNILGLKRFNLFCADYCYMKFFIMRTRVPLVSLGRRLYTPVVRRVFPTHPSGPHPLPPTSPALLLWAGHLERQEEKKEMNGGASRSLIKRSFKVTPVFDISRANVLHKCYSWMWSERSSLGNNITDQK